MRKLVLTSSGLMLEASGGRSLLGGLTFKGKAAISTSPRRGPAQRGRPAQPGRRLQAKAGQPGP